MIRTPLLHEWVEALGLIEARWGTTIVSRGKVHWLRELSSLVAIAGDRLAGCITFAPNGASAEIVSVDSWLPRIGVAENLLQHVFRQFSHVWLITTNDNMPAQRLFSKIGMRLCATHYGALAQSRKLKPSIPLVGYAGQPIEHELEYEWHAPTTISGSD